jgi:hypothetical protein
MMPTIAFADYITAKLKKAIDCGIDAIHVEEPEFWDFGGYSEAFKREYYLYYKEEWIAPHENLDAAYRAAKLKSYLYLRTIDRVCSACKEYSLIKYDRKLRFFVPTHSLLNYRQWKIISPEGSLIDLPGVDGYIAQIWMGTSRTVNVYEGVLKERTFETAFLEYGIMQELVAGTDRRMWFLHDPIEDNPTYSWESYKYNYLKTVAASLLHPKIFRYEICPWPNRVFNGKYPKNAKHKNDGNSLPIPPDYSTLLGNIINTLGDMEQDENEFDGFADGVGIFMSDTSMYQRTYPDSVVTPGEQEKILNEITNKDKDINVLSEKPLHAFASSVTLPDFYGITLPLLKYGLPVRPVLLDNLKRYPSYLDEYKIMVLTYEYMKPMSPDINGALAAWVRSGGVLIYLGDSSDPYHNVKSWWNTGRSGYSDPSHHLFEMLGFDKDLNDGIYNIGKGIFAFQKIRPAEICLSRAKAEGFRGFVKQIFDKANLNWTYRNNITLRRGYYIISAVMDAIDTRDENCGNKTFEGLFADLFTPEFDIITKKCLKPDECALLFDLNKVKDRSVCIIGATNRVESLEVTEKGFKLSAKGAANMNANIRLKLPKSVTKVMGNTDVSFVWDDLSGTVLLKYASNPDGVNITGVY